MRCPSCGASLAMTKDIPGCVFFSCPKCGGRSAGMMLLRKLGMPLEIYDALREAVRAPAKAFARLCPHCGKKMRACEVDFSGARVELDVCGVCDQVWFDPYEFHKAPLDFEGAFRKKEEPQTQIPEKARVAMAMREVKNVAEQASRSGGYFDYDSDGPSSPWQWIPAFFGLPVEMDGEAVRRIPWVTWGLSLVMAMIFLACLSDSRAVIDDWGFICSQWSRHFGLTILTSFFIHGGFLHIIGNLYFFLIFGDNTEDRLGGPLFLLLLLGSHLFGTGVYWVFNQTSPIPSIGASGGIAGVLAFYAVSFPYARIGFLFRYGIFFEWMQMPAFFAFGLYLVLQVSGAYMQLGGFGNVNYLCHLGGMFVGFAAAVAMRFFSSHDAGTPPPSDEDVMK